MALQIQHFEQSATCLWTWPLTIGLLPEDAPYINSLQHKHWTARFGQFVSVRDRRHVNVLLIDTTLGLAVPSLQDIHVECDVIILIMPAAYFQTARDVNDEVAMLKQVAERHASSGVFLVSVEGHVEDWFNEVIVELSHNQSLPDALNIHCAHGSGLTDEQLQHASRLSAVLDDLLLNLYRGEPGPAKKIRINSRLCKKKEYTLQELREELQANKAHYLYQHESGEAEGLKELMESLDASLSSDLDEAPWTGSAATSPPPAPASRPGILGHLLDLIKPEEKPSTTSRGIPKMDPQSFPSLPPFLTPVESMMESSKSEIRERSTPRGGTKAKKEKNATSEKTPRFLQAKIHKDNVVKEYLEPGTEYTLMVRIGQFEQTWESGGEAFPDEAVFAKPKQKPELIQVHFKCNTSNETQEGELTLPRTGNSNEVPFTFKTGKKSGEFKGEIYAYHQNRLIQKAVITAYCVASPAEQKKHPPTQMDVAFSFKTDLNNLEGRTEFGSSILLDSSKPKEEAIQGIASGKSLDLYFSPALDQIMKTIRDRIQEAVVNIEDHPEDLFHPENQKLLLRLALDGNNLFVNHLKKNNSLQGPMQIVTHKSEFVPLDFVYTFASPDKNSTLCPNAVKALKEGKCCNGDGIQNSPAKHICPFGFWGFSHVIERHTTERYKKETTGDYTLIAEPQAGRETLEILKNTLFAGSVKVAAADPTLLKKVNETVSKNSDSSEQAKTWEEWESMVKTKNPDSLILIVHIERDEFTDQDQIEIGDSQFLIQNLMDESKLKSGKAKQPPFVVLLGCEAAQVESHGFDISSQLMNHGAAIVVSNFTKIRGRQAGPIVIKMLEFLKEQKGKEITLGQIVLKLRQQLLAQGIMVGLALITHGDADWKLKV